MSSKKKKINRIGTAPTENKAKAKFNVLIIFAQLQKESDGT